MENYEEKYKKALEVARQIHSERKAQCFDVMAKVFPELAELEDERIKEEIISFVEQAIDAGYGIIDKERKDKWIAWLEKQGEKEKFIKKELGCIQGYREEAIRRLHELEKQGEQNLANFAKTCKDEKTIVIIPKFRVGDVIRPKGSTAEYTIESISGECYHGKGWGLHISCDNDYELVEQKPVEWSEQDERKCNNIIALVEGKAIMRKDIKGLVNWLESLKDRVQPKQKQEWSEEDETIAKALTKAANDNVLYGYIGKNKLLDWLKTLRPQNKWISVDKEVYVKEPVLAQKKDKSDPFKGYVVCCDHMLIPNVYERYMILGNIVSQSHWKPSESDIFLLEEIANGKSNPQDFQASLGGLIGQLKKLREK